MDAQINAIIDNFANKLGIAASEVFYVLQSQATTEIVISGFLIFADLIAIFASLALMQKIFFKADSDGNTMFNKCVKDDNPLFIAYVIIAAIAVTFVIVATISVFECIETIVQCALNPRYWALQQIFDVIKGGD